MQRLAPVYRNSEDLAKGKDLIVEIMRKYKDPDSMEQLTKQNTH